VELAGDRVGVLLRPGTSSSGFGLLKCLFGEVMSGVIRLVAMSFLAVAEK
jgi:hypothetical protein